MENQEHDAVKITKVVLIVLLVVVLGYFMWASVFSFNQEMSQLYGNTNQYGNVMQHVKSFKETAIEKGLVFVPQSEPAVVVEKEVGLFWGKTATGRYALVGALSTQGKTLSEETVLIAAKSYAKKAGFKQFIVIDDIIGNLKDGKILDKIDGGQNLKAGIVIDDIIGSRSVDKSKSIIVIDDIAGNKTSEEKSIIVIDDIIGGRSTKSTIIMNDSNAQKHKGKTIIVDGIQGKLIVIDDIIGN